MSNQNIPSSFLPSTFIWDIEKVRSSNLDPELKDLFIRLYQNLNQVCLVVNNKETSIYSTQETFAGNKYFPNYSLNTSSSKTPTLRESFRKTFLCGPLPNASSISIPHQIKMNSSTSLVRLDIHATNDSGSSMIKIPYASTVSVNDNIEAEVTDTHIVITTAADKTAYTKCYIVIEVLKE